LIYDGLSFFHNKIKSNSTIKNKVDLLFEKFITKVFNQILPNSIIYTNIKYSGDGETDLLVLYDDILLIIECKNGFVTDAIKKGSWNTQKMGKFKEQIVKPYEQAKRTKDYILSNNYSGFTCNGENIYIDRTQIRETFLVAVTSDYWGNLAVYPKHLQQSGEMELKDSFWSVSIQDLLVIRDLIDNSSSIFILYLRRRLEWMKLTKMWEITNEVELFEYFLDTGLLFTEDEFKETKYENSTKIIFDIHSDKIEKYYRCCEQDIPKPSLNTDKRFKEFIKKIEQTNNYGRAEIADFLYSCDYKFHKEFMDLLISKMNWVNQSTGRYDLLFYNLSFPKKFSEEIFGDIKIIFFITRKDSYVKRQSKEMIELKKYELKCNKCFGVCIESDKNNSYFIKRIIRLNYDFEYNDLWEKKLEAKMTPKFINKTKQKCWCGSGLKYKRCHGKNKVR